jgi:hypothetical protein
LYYDLEQSVPIKENNWLSIEAAERWGTAPSWETAFYINGLLWFPYLQRSFMPFSDILLNDGYKVSILVSEFTHFI